MRTNHVVARVPDVGVVGTQRLNLGRLPEHKPKWGGEGCVWGGGGGGGVGGGGGFPSAPLLCARVRAWSAATARRGVRGRRVEEVWGRGGGRGGERGGGALDLPAPFRTEPSPARELSRETTAGTRTAQHSTRCTRPARQSTGRMRRRQSRHTACGAGSQYMNERAHACDSGRKK